MVGSAGEDIAAMAGGYGRGDVGGSETVGKERGRVVARRDLSTGGEGGA
jgi:hypothetical protein